MSEAELALHQPMKLLLDHRPKSFDHRLVTSDDGALEAFVRPCADVRLVAGAIARAARSALGCTVRVWRGDSEKWEASPESVFKARKARKAPARGAR